MENSSCKIDNLSYYTIENSIIEFYDMGLVGSPDFPIV